jgi:group I intron endonuclease
MTCGIYKISFEGTDKVYIGQSTDCIRRLSEHKKLSKAGKWPEKLQNAYNIFGDFKFEILLECNPEELIELEKLAISLYDSCTNGFNSKASGKPTHMVNYVGELHFNSKYSNEKILEVLDVLSDPTKTLDDISEITKVNRSTVNEICRGTSHVWVHNAYPEKWKQCLIAKAERVKLSRTKVGKSASDRGISYPKIKSPNGEIFTVSNVRAFAREHGLDNSSLAKVLKSTPNYKSHKGWSLAE